MTITNQHVIDAVRQSQTVEHRVYVNYFVDHGETLFYTAKYAAYPEIQCIGYAKAGEWFPAPVQGFSLAVALTQPKP